MLPQYNNKDNKVLLCLTDTLWYIYICVKNFGMANIKKKESGILWGVFYRYSTVG